ncbi:unnamed protein product [Moneuplotes crassus]|uniref:RING-type domain-containing protein n=1 Tax=Euplotes crassus TaxID=5936 RepID=A0AAD1YCQ0_EUPCR|nr:unnamed protein product [Moneuplotes crassus]
MECPNCKCIYDNDKIVPRIITDCGHTMCEICINEYCIRGLVFCSVCKRAFPPKWIDFYPINIAIRPIKCETSLISLELMRFEDKNPTPHKYNYLYRSGQTPREENKDEEAKTSGLDIDLGELDKESECEMNETLSLHKHIFDKDLSIDDKTSFNFTKNLDQELLEILDDSKLNSDRSHKPSEQEIQQKAGEILSKIKESVQESSKIEQELRLKISRIESYSRDIQKNYSKNTSRITKLYDDIILALFKQKDFFLAKMKQIYQKESTRCEEAHLQATIQTEDISSLKGILFQSIKQEDEVLYNHHEKYDDLIERCLQKTKEFKIDNPFDGMVPKDIATKSNIEKFRFLVDPQNPSKQTTRGIQANNEKMSLRVSGKCKPSMTKRNFEANLKRNGSRQSSKVTEKNNPLPKKMVKSPSKPNFTGGNTLREFGNSNEKPSLKKKPRKSSNISQMNLPNRVKIPKKNKFSKPVEARKEVPPKGTDSDNSSICETIKMRALDDLEKESMVSCADSTAIVSAGGITSKIDIPFLKSMTQREKREPF